MFNMVDVQSIFAAPDIYRTWLVSFSVLFILNVLTQSFTKQPVNQTSAFENMSHTHTILKSKRYIYTFLIAQYILKKNIYTYYPCKRILSIRNILLNESECIMNNIYLIAKDVSSLQNFRFLKMSLFFHNCHLNSAKHVIRI